MNCVTKSWRSSPWARIALSGSCSRCSGPLRWCLAWKSALPGEARVLFTLDPGRHAVRAGAAVRARRAAAPGGSATSWRLCQIGWSMVFMWLLEGRSEAQFHVFVSLAFLAFYRDWRVLAHGDAHRDRLARAAHRAAARLLHRRRRPPGGASSTRPSGWSREFLHPAARRPAEPEDRAEILRARRDARAHQRSHRQAMSTSAPPSSTRSREQYRLIAETTRAIPFELDLAQGRFTYIGPQAQRILGIPEARWKEPGFLDALLPRDARVERAPAARRMHAGHLRGAVLGGHRRRSRGGAALDRGLRARERHALPARPHDRRHRGAPPGARARRRAQKLESVGRIAAGVAHEINTSVQFISDSVRFVRHALQGRAARARRLSRARRGRRCRART